METTKTASEVVLALAKEMAKEFRPVSETDRALVLTETNGSVFTLLQGDLFWAGIFRDPTKEELAELIALTKVMLEESEAMDALFGDDNLPY